MDVLKEVEERFVYFREYIYEDSYHFYFLKDDELIYVNDQNINEMKPILGAKLFNKILVGHNIKLKPMSCYFKALNEGTTGEVYLNYMKSNIDFDYWNLFTWIDFADYNETAFSMMCANKGWDIGMEYDLDTIARRDLNYLKILYEDVFKFDLEIDLFYLKYKNDLDFILKNKSTKILTEVMAKGRYELKKYDGANEFFKTPPRFEKYFEENLPIDVKLSFETVDAANFKDFKKNNPDIFTINYFDNPGKTGNGGYHSTHDTKKIFIKDKEQYNFFKQYLSDVNHESIIIGDDDQEYFLFHDDGSAYYPNIILVNDLLSRNADYPFYTNLVDSRDIEKKKNPKSLATVSLKRGANSIYGQGGNSRGKLYDPYSQLCITALGQSIIIAYSNKLYKMGCIIYQTNTDGIYVCVPKDKMDEYNAAQKEISEVSGIKFDHDPVRELYQKNVNNYLKIYENGGIEVVGSELCGDYENNSIYKKTYPIMHKAIYEFLVNHVDPKKTIKNCRDLSWFVLTCQKSNYEFIAIANKTNKRYAADEQINYKHIKYDKVNTKGANFHSWDIIYKFKNGVARSIPVKKSKNNVKAYLFKSGASPTSIPSANVNNVFLTRDLSTYKFEDFDIDYDFIIKQTEKRLKVVFGKDFEL